MACLGIRFILEKIFDLRTPPGMPWLMANELMVTVTEWGVDPSKIFGGYASSFFGRERRNVAIGSYPTNPNHNLTYLKQFPQVYLVFFEVKNFGVRNEVISPGQKCWGLHYHLFPCSRG